MAGGSDKIWVLEGPTVSQKNFNFAFSETIPEIQSLTFSAHIFSMSNNQ